MSAREEGDCIKLTRKLYNKPSLHPIISDKIFSIIELLSEDFNKLLKFVNTVIKKISFKKGIFENLLK